MSHTVVDKRNPEIVEAAGYTINDKRGQEKPKPVCRVCGATIEIEGTHSLEYNRPTMDCIKYLREATYRPTAGLS